MTGVEIIAKKGTAHFLLKARHTGYDFLDQFVPQVGVSWRKKPQNVLKQYAAWRQSNGCDFGELRATARGYSIFFRWHKPIANRGDFMEAQTKALRKVGYWHDYQCSYADYQIVLDFDQKRVNRLEVA